MPTNITAIVRPRKTDPLDAAINHFVQMCLLLKKDGVTTAEEGDSAFLLKLSQKMSTKAAQLRKEVQREQTNESDSRSLVIDNNPSCAKEEEATIIFRPRASMNMLHEARYSMPIWKDFIVAANVYAEDQGIDCRHLNFVDEEGNEYCPSRSLFELGFTADKHVVHVNLNGQQLAPVNFNSTQKLKRKHNRANKKTKDNNANNSRLNENQLARIPWCSSCDENQRAQITKRRRRSYLSTDCFAENNSMHDPPSGVWPTEDSDTDVEQIQTIKIEKTKRKHKSSTTPRKNKRRAARK